ncbi:MAG TPA: aminotransferase class I/II-fold pyridoxal phosphate-dependent enzyme [Candidatus Acidoferrales bacterium]|nr:aminotransferase class I/II-fold pyridoxal phosphate-dependent enzyme [Candidatus Acidoferrales bacterium]
MGLLSDRSEFALNPIEEENVLARKLAQKGMKIVGLNKGDPPKYFPTPKYVIDAYVKALREGRTTYSGIKDEDVLKYAVQRRYKKAYNIRLKEEDIIITAGVSEAISFLNSALINKGDIGILFRPYYTIYASMLKMNEGRIQLEDYDENDSWNVHVDKLRKSLASMKRSGTIKKVKYMMITNPNNPTGTVLRRKILEEIADIANEYGILLISDEIYDEIVYNGAKLTSVGQVAKGIPHVILNGASKVYDATGFRVGFAMVPGDDKVSNALKAALDNYALVRLSVNNPALYAVAEAMQNEKEHKKAIRHMVSEIETRVNLSSKLLAETPHLETVEPNGAFYTLPRIHLKDLGMKTDAEFVETLLRETGIDVSRGSGFGAPSHFRIVSLPPKEILGYAINRINDFCRRHSVK